MINNKNTIKEYYAASNSKNGFYSLFDKIFSPEKLMKIYILKGGPGCGKSTAIKKVSEEALKKGYNIENYFCSSSPTSYDGVIIRELSVAVIDGTSPHTADPKFPGVCENIVNLGECWQLKKADLFNEEIRSLCVKKCAAYNKAYSYLSSCSSADKVIDNCLSSYLLRDKMLNVTERICNKYKFRKQSGEIKEVFTDCICGTGNIHLKTFENNSDTLFFIKDFADIAPVFYDYLISELSHRGVNIITAQNPLHPESSNGVYIESARTAFVMYDDEYCRYLDKNQIEYKVINTARFCDKEKFRKNKVFYRYAKKSKNFLMAGAINQLSLAADIHEKIEKLYYKITDYKKVTEMTDKLIADIF